MPPDEVGVPAQQSARGDDPQQLAELAAGQQPGQRGQHRAVGPRQPRVLDLPLENCGLVPQNQDFRVLGTVRPGEQGKPAERAQHRQVRESQ
jgi:hypothetical protein